MKRIIFLALIFLPKALQSEPFPLPNPGVACYLNAAVQGLYAINPLTQFFKSNSDCQNYNYVTIQDYCKLLNAFTHKSYQSEHYNFYKAVVAEMGGDIRQQDIDEFFDIFLEQLKTDKKIGDFAQNLFGYQIKFTINCDKEAQFSDQVLARINEYKDDEQKKNSQVLKLPFSGSLQTSLNTFFQQKASTHPLLRNCTEKFTLTQAPQILFIKVHRFTDNGTKIQDPIDIPFTFNSVAYLQSKNNIEYELIGVMMHAGNNAGGHYTAYIKQDNQWWYCNDTLIAPVTQNQILSDGKLELKNVTLGGVVHNLVEMPIYSIKKGYAYIYQNKSITPSTQPIPTPAPQPDSSNLNTALQNLTGALNNLQNALTSIKKP